MDDENIPVLPPVEGITTRNLPARFPIPSIQAHNSPIPQPTRPEEFPLEFPDGDAFPSDPPIWNAHDSGKNWPSEQGVKSAHPPGRWLHTMVFYEDQLYIWGGVANSASLLNDLWAFSYDETQWTELERPVDPVLPLYPNPATEGTDFANQEKRVVDRVRPPQMPPPPRMRVAPGEPQLRPVETRRPMNPKDYPMHFVEPPPGMKPGAFERKAINILESKWSKGTGTTVGNDDYKPLVSLHPTVSGMPPPGKDMYGPGLYKNPSFIETAESIADKRKMKKEERKRNVPFLHKTQIEAEEDIRHEKEREEKKREAPSLLETVEVLRRGVRAKSILRGASTNEKRILRKAQKSIRNRNRQYVFTEKKLSENNFENTITSTRRRQLLMTSEKHEHIANSLADTMMTPTLSDMWCYNITERQWYSPFAKLDSPRPPARWSHGAAVLSDQNKAKMFIFGGVSNNLMLLNDTWSYDLKTLTWKEEKPKGDMILAREGMAVAHSCKDKECIVGDKMIVFGGVGLDYRPLDDLYIYDPASAGKWNDKTREEKVETGAGSAGRNARKKVGTVSGWPEGRWMASLVCYTMGGKEDNACILFGGCGIDGGPLDDVWMLKTSGTKPSFTMLLPSSEGMYPPPARWLHSSVMIETYEGPAMLVHGGAANNILMDDLWFFQIGPSKKKGSEFKEEFAWVEMFAIGNTPMAREGHTSVAIVNPGVARAAKSSRRRLLMDDEDVPEFIMPTENYLKNERRIRSDQTNEGRRVFSDERNFWLNYENLRRNSGGNVWMMIFGGGAEQGNVAAAQGGDGTIF
eukprot:g1717.t1